MPRSREELRLITSEAELRVGMLVEVRPCRLCGRQHRLILARAADGPCSACGRLKAHGFWEAPVCGDADCFMCFVDAVSERRLYEVRSRRDDEAEQERRRLDDERRAGAVVKKLTERARR